MYVDYGDKDKLQESTLVPTTKLGINLEENGFEWRCKNDSRKDKINIKYIQT